jgi:hypothetical protein
MGMQTDVKSNHLNSSGSVYSARTRVKGIVICASASLSGTLILRDGGSSGTNMIELDIPSNSNPNSFYMQIPGEGVLFVTNVYATMTNLASITVFYG